MAIKGADIVKKLPGTNCKECGSPTCFGFAMKLASGSTTMDKCPYLSPEVRAELEEVMAPPMKLVTIGCGANALSIGEEEVMYRHEKTFIHQPGIALLVSDKEDDTAIEHKIRKIEELQFERVGVRLKADLLAVSFDSGDRLRFEAVVRRVSDTATSISVTKKSLILISSDLDALFAARDICAHQKPLLYPITAENINAAIPKIKQKPTPVAVRGEGVESLIPLTTKLREAGIEEIVLDPGSKNLTEAVRDQTLIRRAALKHGFRLLGYPTIVFPCFTTAGVMEEILTAAAFIDKYASIIVLSDIERDSLYPLLVQRLNIYTDPRRPMTVEEKIYEINEPTTNSPVLVTTNFALTYFAVSSEIEGSKVPSFLCVKDTGGLCVLAAWSAGKFTGDTVGPFLKKCGIADRAGNKRAIIPGLAARIREELEDELPTWEIVVGPREASDIPTWLPAQVEKWKQH